jgi:hypothetical protein
MKDKELKDEAKKFEFISFTDDLFNRDKEKKKKEST